MLDDAVVQEHCVVGVVLVRKLGYGFHCGGEAYVDFGLAFLTAFGGDENYAVGAFHTIDCGGRCVLECGDGLDGADVDGAHGAFDTIDEHQGRAVVPGGSAADGDLGFFVAGHTAALGRHDAGHVTGKGVADVMDTGSAFEHGTGCLGDGAHYGCFFLMAVAYNHDFLKSIAVGLEGNVDFATSVDFDFL